MRIIFKKAQTAGIILLFSLAACIGIDEENRQNTVLHISFPYSVVGLDPVKDFSFHSSVAIMKLIYPPLYRAPEDPLNILEIVETSDYKTYTLKVKKGLRFQNDPCFPDGWDPVLTAENIRDVFERTGSNTAHDSPVIEKIRSIRSIEIKNPHTLILGLKKPDRWFMEVLASPELSVIPKEALDCYGDNIRFHPVSSGPFRLASWNEKEIILVRNEPFKSKEVRSIKQIHLVFTKDQAAAYNEFRQGLLDIIPLPPSLAEQIVRFNPISRDFEIKKAANHSGMKVFSGKNLQLIYCTLYSIKDPLVRRAVNYAVNRDKIKANRSDWIPAAGPLFDFKNTGFIYDVDKARELLEEAGFPEGKGLKTPYFLHTSEGGIPIAEGIRDDLEKIGIQTEIVNTSWVGYQQIKKRDMDIAKFASLGPDPFKQLNVYQNPTFMILNREINNLTRQLMMDRKNEQLVRTLTEEIFKDPPLIFLFWIKNIYLSQPNISGIDPDWYGLSPYLDKTQ